MDIQSLNAGLLKLFWWAYFLSECVWQRAEQALKVTYLRSCLELWRESPVGIVPLVLMLVIE